MNLLASAIRADGEYRELLAAARGCFAGKPLPLLSSGLCDGAAETLLMALTEDLCLPDGAGRPRRAALLFCPEEKDCLRLCAAAERFGLRALFYAARDLSLYGASVAASHEYEHERLRVLSALAAGSCDLVVTTPDAALGYTIPPDRLTRASVLIDQTARIDLPRLSAELVAAGYARTDLVEGPGQFAVRGGIVDVCAPFGSYEDPDGAPIEGAYPLRMELFGDEIDRMALFDPENQRMVRAVRRASLLPARELLTDRDGLAALESAILAQRRTAAGRRPQAAAVLDAELSAVAAARAGADPTGTELSFLDKYIRVIYPDSATLLDYFPAKTLCLVRQSAACAERLQLSDRREGETVRGLLEDGALSGRYAGYRRPAAAFEDFLAQHVTVRVDALSYAMPGRRVGGVFGFLTRRTVSYAERLPLLCEDLTAYMRTSFRLIVTTENEAAARSLAEMLDERGFDCAVLPDRARADAADLPPGQVTILPKDCLPGFELTSPKIAVLSTGPEIRSVSLPPTLRERGRAPSARRNARALLSLDEMEVGDLVVHETYGIGRYTGIETLTTGGVTRDYIGIQYAGPDKLFVPVEKMDRVSRYIGARSDTGAVRLSSLGSDRWARTKARTRTVVREMAKDLIRLYAERLRRPGHAFPPDDDFQRDFEAAFEYGETEGQAEASGEIKADMERPVPMDRLLCGDVGYGKTEVAIRAAFKAVAGGKQVAVLVPTTILAMQHFETFTRRMRSFSVRVDMLSRFRSAQEQEVVLRRLARGDTDVVIGTHRLLGRDVSFHDLGLLIVDEEQRFGVAQKEALKRISGNIDVLTLSATPIPRTLNMAMSGIRDISFLDEGPGDRLPVQTYVLEYDELILRDAIRRELRRGGQVFYLHNVVETVGSVAAEIAKAFPEARVTAAHGRMSRDLLEEIWGRMLSGEIDILVSTTIIEAGVDVPNANTLIVEAADRMGLSQLHQLRGRVGRSSRRAYAYFTYRRGKALTDVAEKRLSAIRDYAEFGAGFRIAMRDMEIRGTGNLFGAEQHGHMEAVGYDLYIKMLNDAVLEEKGELPPAGPECAVSIQVDAFLPDSYVRSPSQRMALYKRIALIRAREDLADMTEELTDRYGAPPVPAANLLRIALIRSLGGACGLTSVRFEPLSVTFTPETLALDVWSELSDLVRGRLRLLASERTPAVRLTLAKGEDALGIVLRLLEKYLALSREAPGGTAPPRKDLPS